MQQRESARDLAHGKWPAILGQFLDERAINGRHTGCPMCGGKDRFRFDNKDGAGTWFCTNCGSGDGFHLLEMKNGWTFKEAAEYVERTAGKFQAQESQAARGVEDVLTALGRVWKGTKQVEVGDPVDKYLRNRCHEVPTCLHEIRFHPSLAYRHDDGSTTKHPALVARVVNGTPKRAVCLHRIYLTEDGHKAAVPTPKKLMTPIQKLENVAVRLMQPEDGWLGIAEGIETAVAAWRRFGGPVWAALTSGLLKSFRPPPEVKLLTIFGDNDLNYVGQSAAYELARSCAMRGLEVKVAIPEKPGTDWAD